MEDAYPDARGKKSPKMHQKSSVVDPDPHRSGTGSGSGIKVPDPDPAKSERA